MAPRHSWLSRSLVMVLAISGSLRAESSNSALVRAIAGLEGPGVVTVYGGLGDLPLFSPDLDSDTPPPAVADLRAQIDAADAVWICTPEYAHGMPGGLKNGLDWLVSSGTLYRKPVAAVSASPSAEGGHRALAQLRQTLAALDAEVPAAASFAVPRVRQSLDGERVRDAETERQLRAALAALADAMDRGAVDRDAAGQVAAPR